MKKNQSASNVFIYFTPPNIREGNAEKFTYKKLEASDTGKIAEKFGDYITRFKCLHFGDGCLTIGAFNNHELVGIISAYMRFLPAPLEEVREAVIDVLEVDYSYRRQGVARELVTRVEQWAREYRALQIRTWCSGEKTDYIKAMYSLGYCMCPVKIWVETRKEEAGGFYAVKVLNSVEKTFI